MSAVKTPKSLWSAAHSFAAKKHAGQVRKHTNEPYINHCVAVANLVQKRGGSPEVTAAAVLHDTLEDTDTSFGELEEAFGRHVALLVFELTDQYTPEHYPELNRKARKIMEAERLGGISDEAKLIKVCDLIDNTRTITEHDANFSVIYLREKADILEAMGYGAESPDLARES